MNIDDKNLLDDLLNDLEMADDRGFNPIMGTSPDGGVYFKTPFMSLKIAPVSEGRLLFRKNLEMERRLQKTSQKDKP